LTDNRREAGGTAPAIIALCLVLLFAGLGTWQVQRRSWKLDLIARVNARVHAAPTKLPAPEQWPQVNAANDEYRHVRLQGLWLRGSTTRVQALTERGAGFWLLSPLKLVGGGTVLVNRGFVLPDAPNSDPPDSVSGAQPVTVTGLLRMSEPGGSFLRRNDAQAGRWYSRDVQAIARARGLHQVAPFFIDAEAEAEAEAGPHADAAASSSSPLAGLTVIRFPNNHLVYAITWYALALMSAWAAWRVAREPSRRPDSGEEG
jgi:surfeit locus 1 family protein